MSKMKQKLQEIWDDIVYYIVDNPKHIYRNIRCWYYVNCNKNHFKTVNYAMFHSYPWDAEYFYELQYNWIKESLEYFKTCTFISDDHRNEVLRSQKLALSLLEIITNKRDLFDYNRENGELVYVPLVYVNLKTKHRYKYKTTNWENGKTVWSDEFYDKSPDELYKEKARQLYNRLIKDYSIDWWD